MSRCRTRRVGVEVAQMLGAKGANDRVGAVGGDLPFVEVTAYGDSVVATDG
jgi:hypothetical protein